MFRILPVTEVPLVRSAPRRSPVPEPARAHPEAIAFGCLESSFRAWVEGRAKADVLVVGTFDPVTMTLERALHYLASSSQPLAPARGCSLGLSADVTIGTAAQALLSARNDPDGPHCRSYRSATFYLIGHALLEVDEEPEQSAPEPAEVPRRMSEAWASTSSRS